MLQVLISMYITCKKHASSGVKYGDSAFNGKLGKICDISSI